MREGPTSCGSVVVVCRRAAAERTETRHDDQTERDEDDLRTENTQNMFIEPEVFISSSVDYFLV